MIKKIRMIIEFENKKEKLSKREQKKKIKKNSRSASELSGPVVVLVLVDCWLLLAVGCGGGGAEH